MAKKITSEIIQQMLELYEELGIEAYVNKKDISKILNYKEINHDKH